MVSNALTGQIEALVDSLRDRREASLSLAEVSGVTEILIKTMQLYFRSLDVRIYEECQSLSDYISNARKEIAALQPENLEGSRIPRAGKELDAIVRQTEEATNTIMDASEKIMGAETEDPESFKSYVHEQVMRIFEACSFQDITGQRISKVVETLSYIEERANQLKGILGVAEGEAADERNDIHRGEDKALLSGPALEGEGIDQAEVDALMGETPAEPAAQQKTKPVEVEPAAAPEVNGAPASLEPKAPKKAAIAGRSTKRNGVSKEEAVEELDVPEDEEGRTTQAEIDELFN